VGSQRIHKRQLKNKFTLPEECSIDWNGRKILVTSGASFIGSRLVEALVERGVVIRMVDDLSSGKIENIHYHLDHSRIEFIQVVLRGLSVIQ
jgi:nucleoside-diphosphate-sugar epimerase